MPWKQYIRTWFHKYEYALQLGLVICRDNILQVLPYKPHITRYTEISTNLFLLSYFTLFRSLPKKKFTGTCYIYKSENSWSHKMTYCNTWNITNVWSSPDLGTFTNNGKMTGEEKKCNHLCRCFCDQLLGEAKQHYRLKMKKAATKNY